ncbi:hypothetical protein [Bacillus sp. V5-8f]|uniref:hypothetical protein n=1 Tax=Bacillus sp. V5-8f TaxID=2053044 RepID=UPI000C7583BD|nr:hypothetical protein [Bacillus sp. V5-8f]PLT32599.1 hypothetical protein CUU64_18185 [Bacillus sp. V5-8f]
MYQKNCGQCRELSFSSCESGEWLCPTCGNDLTDKKALIAENEEKKSRRMVLYVSLMKSRR